MAVIDKSVRPFGAKDQFGYVLGDMAGSFVNLFVDAYFLTFCTYALGIDAAWMAGLFLVARLWDAVNGPIIGIFPDRWHLGMARKWCSMQEKPSYNWYFNRKLPGDDNGAWHSSDLWYWFGTLPNCWRPMTEKDYALSEQMIDYLCSFAKGGNPNMAGQPEWKTAAESQNKVMVMGEGDTKMAKPSMLKMIKTMLTNRAVGE